MNDRIKGMILGSIVGDALGTPIDGLSKGHISAVFKEIDTYIDPSPALKGKMECWKKPGSYSSISQMIILLSYIFCSKKKINEIDLIELIKEIPETPESRFGIFRHPYNMEKKLVERARRGDLSDKDNTFSHTCARLAAIIPSIIVYNSKSYIDFIFSALSFSILLNKNVESIVGALIFAALLRRSVDENEVCTNIILLTINEIDLLKCELDMNTDRIFDLGINPDTFLSILEEYRIIMYNIKDIDEKEKVEEVICSYINKKNKTPIKRATVNHPICLIPYAIFLTDKYYHNYSDILFIAAEEGGATSILCTLIGSLIGSLYGTESIPSELLDKLINKKRINTIVDTISKKRVLKSTIDDFIKTEASLTAKEFQELNAKIKHITQKKKIKKKKTIVDREATLSKHVVESWTKIEKAKWRKRLEE